MPSSPLLTAIHEFTSSILNPYDLQELLHRLTGHAIAVTGAHGAGIMLSGHRGLGFAAASDDDVIEIEVTQDRSESGTCHAAFTSNQVVVVEDLGAIDQWPEYRERALALGFESVVGLPMNASGQTIGVLNIYRRSAGTWSAEDIEAAEILTAMGAGYVLHANQLRAQHDLTDQLQTALESRDAIGQAKGVLMERHGVSSGEAFERLRSMSQDANVKLREVARRLVEPHEEASDAG